MQTEWAYLAGIIDGEGCITISKSYRKERTRYRIPQYRLNLSVATKGSTIPQACQDITNYGRVYIKSPGVFHWIIEGWRCAHILEDTLPYLRLKIKQAQIGLDFFEHKQLWESKRLTTEELEIREQFYLRLKEEKRYGYAH